MWTDHTRRWTAGEVLRAWKHAPIGVSVLDPRFRFVWINDELARMNGRPAADHIGRRLDEILPAASLGPITELIAHCIRSGELVGPRLLSGPENEPVLVQRHVGASYLPIFDGDELEAVATFVSDITAEVHARHRATAIERIADRLRASVTPQETVHAALTEAVALLGGVAAAFGEVTGDRLQVVTVGLDNELLDQLTPEAAQISEATVSIPLDRPWPLCEVARTGKSLTFTSVSAACTAFPDLLAISEFTSHGAFHVAPVLGPDGTPRGIFEVHWPREREVLPAERQMVDAFAGLAGQALERSRLADEQRTRAIRATHRVSLAEGLATARTPEQVASVFADSGLSAMGAHTGGIYLREGHALHLIDYRTDNDALAQEWATVPLITDAPICRVVATGRPEVLPNRQHIAEAYPHLVGLLADRSADTAWVTHPLRFAGQVSGAITVTFDDGEPLTDSRLLAVDAAVQLVEDALERTTESTRDHRVVLALQERVTMGSPASLGGYQFGYRYRPADLELAAGGDWLDVRPIEDTGQIAVLIGDVVGHGLDAVLCMTELRSAAAALIAADPAPATVHARLTRIANEIPGAFCATLLYAQLDPDGTLQLVRAGHLPPVLHDSTGLHVFEEPGQPPLGLSPGATGPSRLRLAPHARLVLFTDGLIERRGLSIDDGYGLLRDALSAIPFDVGPQQTAETLIGNLLPERTTDDAAILVIQRSG